MGHVFECPLTFPIVRRKLLPFVAASGRLNTVRALIRHGYGLGNFLRTLATPEPIRDWSLTSLREKLIKIGAKIISHGRYVAFQMAEVAVTEAPVRRDPAAHRRTAAAA